MVLDTSSNLQAGFLRGNPPDLGLLNYNKEMARFMAARRAERPLGHARGAGASCPR